MELDYLNRELAVRAIRRMQRFERDVEKTFKTHGLTLRENLGRRNGVVSYAHERFFAEEIKRSGERVIVSGRTGEPDIMLPDRERELECKLTSGSGGSWNLQTDYSTLVRKGEIDYLYVLANEEFNRFAVLWFERLTSDDFYPPAPGAREKARMKKSRAMQNCIPLLGNVINRNDVMMDSARNKGRDQILSVAKRITELTERLEETTAPKEIERLVGVRERELERCRARLGKTIERYEFWRGSPSQFTIELEEV